MFLAEAIAQKRILDKKIKELNTILRYQQDNDVVEELFTLLELRQGKLLLISAANAASKISIGGTEVNISVAVQIRVTIKEKIDVLTRLIDSKECTLDKLELLRQRDKFYAEYILLTMGITKNDLQVTVGQEDT